MTIVASSDSSTFSLGLEVTYDDGLDMMFEFMEFEV